MQAQDAGRIYLRIIIVAPIGGIAAGIAGGIFADIAVIKVAGGQIVARNVEVATHAEVGMGVQGDQGADAEMPGPVVIRQRVEAEQVVQAVVRRGILGKRGQGAAGANRQQAPAEQGGWAWVSHVAGGGQGLRNTR